MLSCSTDFPIDTLLDAGAFKQQLLYQGGCLATERLHLLHGNAAVTDTYEVIDVSAYSNLRCSALYLVFFALAHHLV